MDKKELIKKAIEFRETNFKTEAEFAVDFHQHLLSESVTDNEWVSEDGTSLNRYSYELLIDNDIEMLFELWGESLERKHIIEVLRWSVNAIYGPPKQQ